MPLALAPLVKMTFLPKNQLLVLAPLIIAPLAHACAARACAVRQNDIRLALLYLQSAIQISHEPKSTLR